MERERVYCAVRTESFNILHSVSTRLVLCVSLYRNRGQLMCNYVQGWSRPLMMITQKCSHQVERPGGKGKRVIKEIATG
jgi:hypothetical protein